MKKPVKTTLWVVGIILAVLLAAIICFILFLDIIVAKSVTVFGSKMTGTEVGLKDISISLISPSVKIDGFSVANPKGYTNPNAFDLDGLRAAIRRDSIFSNKLVIEEIIIDGARISYEPQLNGDSNLGDIKKHIDSMSPKPKDEKPAEKPAEPPVADDDKKDQPKKTVVVKLFRMTNCTVSITSKLLAGKNITIPLPDIEMRDIGEKKSTSPEEVLDFIYEDILMAVIKAASKATSAIPVQETLDKVSDNAGEILKQGEKEGKKVIESIKNLF